MLERTEFGTFTTEFSKVLILVLLNVISSTVPSKLSNCIQSPTANGLSKNITNPPNKFLAVSCAARVTITPVIPKPAISPFKLIPNVVTIKNPATIYIITLIAFRIKFIDESISSLFAFFNHLITSVELGTKLCAKPLANIKILTIIKHLFTKFITCSLICNGLFKNNIATYIPSKEMKSFSGL